MTHLNFRAYHHKMKKMLTVRCIDFHNKSFDCIDGDECFLVKFEDCEIMQSTGLTDKNGKEIYEGDIVKGFYNYSTEIKRAVIKFRIGRFEIESFRNISIDEFLLGNKTNLEIIGNIYENPELLNS